MPTPPPSSADLITPDVARQILRSLDADQVSTDVANAPDNCPSGVPTNPNYRIVAAIGEGGGGSVYRAFRDGSDRPVAIKIIRDVAGEAGLQRARRELEMLESLHLPCVPRILDYGVHQGRLYIAEDFVDGQRLDDHAAGLPAADTKARVRLLVAVAHAVQTLHERGVIHRDLKPANILVTPTGDVVIVDFGLAFNADAPIATLSQTDAPIGTPAFMAPEQARGERDKISTRTDVYGLGATAFLILTGHTPHDTNTTLHTAISRVAHEPPREPRTLQPNLPKPLAAILGKACARDPATRYASAADLAKDLERWLRGEAVEATTPGMWQRATRWAGRRPKATTAMVCGMILLAATSFSGVYVWWVLRVPHSLSMVGHMDNPNTLGGVRLVSRAGNILHEWRGERGEIVSAHFVRRPKAVGGGALVLITRADHPRPGLYAYDAEHPDRDPLWESGYGPENFNIPYRPGLDEYPFFEARNSAVTDVFDEVPGDEIVVVHNHKPEGLSVIRVYSLAGSVLYEAWHLGHVNEVYWMKGEKLLILRGCNNETEWKCRGRPETTWAWPIVVFAISPSSAQDAAGLPRPRPPVM